MLPPTLLLPFVLGRKKEPDPPVLQSGSLELFGRPAWLVGFCGLCALHVFCYFMATSRLGFSGSPLAKQPHLAAHFLPQLVGFLALAYYGGGAWINDMPPVETAIGDYLYVGERVSCIMIAFQMYEIAATIPAKRLRGLYYEMVGHHCITLLLSVLAYHYQAYHYWAPCFMGMAEISSVPLAFVDFFKMFPAVKAALPTTNELSRNCFAALFLPIRGVYWPYSSYKFWRTSLAFLAAVPMAAQPPSAVVYTFCACNVVMTLLQWYWASLILKALFQLLRGDPSHKEA